MAAQGGGPTRALADFIVGASAAELPGWALHEAKRTLINILGIAVSATRYEPAGIVGAWVRRQGGNPAAGVIGTDIRTGTFNAALANGYLAHLEDYDDTHLPTILHPSAPVWPAVLAAAEETGASGLDTLAAFALGAETACRVAMSVYPWHYDQGWHVTGTAGLFGAVAGAGRVHGLDGARMTHALGVGGTHASGVRELLGTHGKALHPGHAASTGLQAAELAAQGFTGPEDILAGRRGFWAILSAGGHSEEALLGGLGERWELRNNGLKPFANGIVSHPIQDGVIRLRNEHALKPGDVAGISLGVHPLVLELMNRPVVRTGLEGKFSFQHCAAAALVDGAGHDAQFTDAKAADPDIARIRGAVTGEVEDAVAEDQARVRVHLADGRTLETFVEHAIGTPQNPMSDAALEAKFTALATEVFPTDQAARLLDAAWNLDRAPGVAALMRLAAAQSG